MKSNETDRHTASAPIRAVLIAATALVVLLAGPASAHAAFGIAELSGEVTANAAGDPATQAGSHPFDATTTFKLNTVPAAIPFLGEEPEGQVKDVKVDLPPGFIVNPLATPRCAEDLLSDPNFQNGTIALCPGNTQVGVATVLSDSTGFSNNKFVPVFNVEPAADEPARLAINVAGTVVPFTAEVRSGGDYGLTANVTNVAQTLKIRESSVTLWGVPADPAHDVQRGDVCNSIGAGPLTCPVDAGVFAPGQDGSALLPAGAARLPLLTNPTDCSAGPLPTTMRISSWGTPDVFSTAFFDHDVNGVPMAVENCEQVPFVPTLTVQPTNTQPDAPTGLEVELRVPQGQNPDGLASAHLKKAVVTLPEGMSVSPASAHGLDACSPAQIGLDNGNEPSCPDASRVGTLEVDTPLLEEPLTGEVYVAQQNANPFGTLLAIYLVARSPGVLVKLAGRVDANPVTGQLTTTVDNNPQLPFSSFRLHFKGGPTAPLANPPTCGVKTMTAELSPWSGTPPLAVTDSFAIDCPGSDGFAPSFAAGATLPVGGAFSPFAVRINRPDRQQVVDGLSMVMPPGLIAKVKDVALCPDAVAGPGSPGVCPAESRVGTVTVGAGAGGTPYHVQGSAYLTGAYKGGPYGLSVQVQASAGPFNLGMVKVRQAILVDPTDAHLTVISDPFPTILEGIPLRVRSVAADVDRPEFTINPTSCSPKEIRARLTSPSGAAHDVVERFQVGDCRALSLKPKLALRLTGRKQTRDGEHPGLRAILRQGAGQANPKKVSVALPLSLALDPDNAQSDALCEFEAGQRVDCPLSSIIGQAKAISPALKAPLTGPVHFVKNIRIDRRTGRQIRTLPTLLIPLRGEVAINLRATSTVKRGKLVNTFDAIPDAPVSRFELNLKGGRKGILVVTNDRNLCKGKHVADVEVDGHNGRRADQAVKMRTPCARRASRGGRGRRAGAS